MSWPTSNKALSANELRRAAIDLLARRDYSRYELWQKLSVKAVDANELEHVLDDLSERQWQSDARFARLFLSSSQQRGHGPLRIQQGMRQKGIASAEIDVAFAEADVDWCALAMRVVQKKAATLPDLNQKSREKLYRFLASRGFDGEHIRVAMTSLSESE
ncbi:MAG: regulatory protein RecX [Bacterioplanes sp.]|nr:regulatory protein RecX [Bacterioplanes sp.]